MYITPSFTRQGSQVRTLYHPPVMGQLNQALTRNRSAFFTFKSSINTPYYYSYISTLVLIGCVRLRRLLDAGLLMAAMGRCVSLMSKSVGLNLRDVVSTSCRSFLTVTIR